MHLFGIQYCCIYWYVCNYRGLSLHQNKYVPNSTFEKAYEEYKKSILKIPSQSEGYFFKSQRAVFDSLSKDRFSYSGPTSMGKSFVMRVFIKEQIVKGIQSNFAIVVPTKALINEVSSRIITDLKELLAEKNYRVVTAGGAIALQQEHNFILALTPERLLYLLLERPDFKLDYLFIDEAHKISSKDSRSPFYYKIVDLLSKRDVDYPQLVSFLEKLCDIFKWEKYEKATLGHTSIKSGQHGKLRWYAVILYQWISGNGLSLIMQSAIKYKKDHPSSGVEVDRKIVEYDDSIKHRNIVISDTLNAIEDVILFRIANYFLRFSSEYKRFHNIDVLPNDWYEYVEYGTTNPLTIFLQRNGFSREASTYIKQHLEYITEVNGEYKVKTELLDCPSKSVCKEAAEIKYNIPELFFEA